MALFKSPLFKVAMFGGVAVIGATTWMESRMQSQFRQQDFYQKPLLMLHKYKPAEQFFGRPIYGGRLSLGDESKLKVDEFTAKLSIPVVGPKDKGVLYVAASRESREKDWNIDVLDLEITRTKQRWKFYDRTLDKNSTPDLSDNCTEETSGHLS
ncbi:cytochrome c oxidase assembly factor 1 homolog [Aplysia californica]|uniref:Cytochrome c oxidase assembly factor 1 homolog n=1 Tax=Aplysia californica TaxID=6500 RepID=A0ABM0JGI3_APLCA|nr:cytochrome c oxidase assembly factor 1 homolog [Aplysia californica]